MENGQEDRGGAAGNARLPGAPQSQGRWLALCGRHYHFDRGVALPEEEARVYEIWFREAYGPGFQVVEYRIAS
jgi:hypothetical protein